MNAAVNPQSKRKRLLLRLGASILLIVAILAVWKIPQQQLAPLKAKIQRERNILQPQERLKLEHDARKLENDARTTLIQTLGGAVLLIGLYFTAKTLRITQEGQFTDRFTKAINQLGEAGSEKLSIRLGGIYALERIARDSERDHWPIMEILTAFVRERTPWPSKDTPLQQGNTLPRGEQPKENNLPPPKPATDIQAVLTVLGRRRTYTYFYFEVEYLNLANTNLRGANLRAAQLQGANLWGAQLERADLWGAQLEKARGLTIEQLATVKTLYKAQLDQSLLAEIRLHYPQLLEEP